MKGIQIRSKTKWVEEDEKSTKYFLNLEKCNSYRKAVTVLTDDNGTCIIDQDRILEEEINYFSSLYKSQNNPSRADLDEFFNDVDIPKLNDDEQILCIG